jgi:catechol 2,3-dioxygenase-like lactoylglutathione lyase family enzyme
MATAKKARAKTASRSKKKNAPAKKKGPAKKKVLVKRSVPANKTPPSVAAATTRVLKARRLPETLRLTGFTPSLTVNDLAKSLAFYTGPLGFIVGQEWKDGEVLRGAMLKAGACELAISQDDGKLGTDRKKGLGFRIWCYTVQDIDAIAARLKAAGHALTEEPADHPAYGVRSLSVDDPDGFHLTLARRL